MGYNYLISIPRTLSSFLKSGARVHSAGAVRRRHVIKRLLPATLWLDQGSASIRTSHTVSALDSTGRAVQEFLNQLTVLLVSFCMHECIMKKKKPTFGYVWASSSEWTQQNFTAIQTHLENLKGTCLVCLPRSFSQPPGTSTQCARAAQKLQGGNTLGSSLQALGLQVGDKWLSAWTTLGTFLRGPKGMGYPLLTALASGAHPSTGLPPPLPPFELPYPQILGCPLRLCSQALGSGPALGQTRRRPVPCRYDFHFEHQYFFDITLFFRSFRFT